MNILSLTLALHALLVSVGGIAKVQETAALLEEGFEDAVVGDGPPNWFQPAVGPEARTVAGDAFEGEQFARLDLGPESEEFGNLIGVLELGLETRSRVAFDAAVRVSGAEAGRAQLWLRFDYDDGSSVLVDNMQDRPITAGEWDEHRIVADLDAKPARVVFGLMAFDGARADLDSVRLRVLGPAPNNTIPPRPLEDRGLANLMVFARLFGIVRYFHPSDEVAEADWDAFAIRAVPRIESARDAEHLGQILSALFEPLAPTVAIHAVGEEPALHPALLTPPDRARARSWRHLGLGNAEDSHPLYKSLRSNKRVKDGELPEQIVDPAAPYRAEIGGGLACSVPLGLYSTRTGTHPAGAGVEPQDSEGMPALTGTLQSEFTAEDRTTRLAAVVLAWNVFQHFYPYFDVVEVDWPAELERALRAAAEDTDGVAFADTLRRMVAALRDGHGGVRFSGDPPLGRLPLEWTRIDDELIVTWVGEAAGNQVEVGDSVGKFHMTGVRAKLQLAEEFLSAATPQFLHYRSARHLLRGPLNESLRIGFKREDGQGHDGAFLTYIEPQPGMGEPRPGPIVELEPGIWYVDTRMPTTEPFLQHLDEIAGARAVIFDVRGYPSGFDAFQFFPHLIREPVESARWHIPIFTRPNQEGLEHTRSNWTIPPKAPYIEAQRVFLTDGRAVSYAETCMGIVEHYELGEIVGEPTAGTNGNVNTVRLPGGYTLTWTGMRVLKHDGSRHHGVGVQPTVSTSRTRAGITAGIDEQLEAALELVR